MADAPTPLLPHEEPLPPRTDLWIAAGFLLLSATVLTLSVGMPTYSDQGGPIYTAPGLVPSFYGVVIGVLSLWLGLRALRGGALASAAPDAPRPDTGNSTARLALAAGLGLFFVVGLIGRMPFWLAASIFVALFIIAFEWRPGVGPGARIRPIATALVQGLVTGALVTLVFERLFLVRLP
jgi:hypothetical protein